MGLFNSLINSAIRRTVNDVVDKAVDQAFNNVNAENSNAQTQPSQQPTTSRIVKPNLSSKRVEHFYFPHNGDEMNFYYNIPEKLYESDCGAAEIPIYYIIANSEDDAFADDLHKGLPEIYFGDDELRQGSNLMRSLNNMVETDVVDQPIIKKKYEYDFNSSLSGATHCIAYKFFACEGDENKNDYTVLTLSIPKSCDAQITSYAIQALNLIASTLSFTE